MCLLGYTSPITSIFTDIVKTVVLINVEEKVGNSIGCSNISEILIISTK